MLLVIDVGNTQIKAAVFEQNTLLKKEIIAYEDWQISLKKLIKKFSEISILVVASVGKLEKSDFLTLESGLNVYFITRESKFPFQNHSINSQSIWSFI